MSHEILAGRGASHKCQLSKWLVVRYPMYLVRLPDRQMATWSMGHPAMW